MADLDPRALEAAARALHEYHEQHESDYIPWGKASEAMRYTAREDARAAVTAYLDAMPPPVSPELIAKLNALASRLTQMGEYEAVDLIDTVVARLTPALAQDTRP